VTSDFRALKLFLIIITRNRLFDTKIQSYENIWGNSNKIIFIGCKQHLYLVQDSFTDYLLCVSFNERVAGHNERITAENRHTSFV